MSEVISFKVSREIKERMKKFRNKVDWSAELRRFVEQRLRELEADEKLEAVAKELEKASWSIPTGFSKKSVREDRARR